jgi:hypothetical protein
MNTASSSGSFFLFLREAIDELLEVHAANQFHRDVVNAVHLAELVGLNDVRVNQISDELRFADEIVDELLLICEGLTNDFDRHALHEIARAMLFGFIHDAHPAFENFADDFVALLGANGEEACHGRACSENAKSSQAPARSEIANFLRKS